MIQPKKPKRCRVCGKILTSFNKSGLCAYHYAQEHKRKRLPLQNYYKDLNKMNLKDVI